MVSNESMVGDGLFLQTTFINSFNIESKFLLFCLFQNVDASFFLNDCSKLAKIKISLIFLLLFCFSFS